MPYEAPDPKKPATEPAAVVVSIQLQTLTQTQHLTHTLYITPHHNRDPDRVTLGVKNKRERSPSPRPPKRCRVSAKTSRTEPSRAEPSRAVKCRIYAVRPARCAQRARGEHCSPEKTPPGTRSRVFGSTLWVDGILPHLPYHMPKCALLDSYSTGCHQARTG